MDRFTPQRIPGPRYDRIVPVVTLVVAGLAIAFVLDTGSLEFGTLAIVALASLAIASVVFQTRLDQLVE